MLSRLWSPKFRIHEQERPVILFHAGLNLIEGADDAQNSIGKSTLLQIIDFIYAGNQFCDSEVVKLPQAVGHHTIYFTLRLHGVDYHFSRSTDRATFVKRYADPDWKIEEEELTLPDYADFLTEQYGLDELQTSWRSIVGRFARLDEEILGTLDRPLAAASREGDVEGAIIMLRLFHAYEETVKIQSRLQEVEKESSTLSNMAKGQYSPYISLKNKKERKQAELELKAAEEDSRKLRLGMDLDLFESDRLNIAEKESERAKLRPLTSLLSQLQGRLANVEQLLEGHTRITTQDLEEFYSFFPEANREKLETVEYYHHELSKILHSQLIDQRDVYRSQIQQVKDEIHARQTQILALGETVQMDETTYQKSLEVDGRVNQLKEQIRAYDTKLQLDAEKKELRERMKSSIPERLNQIAETFNECMEEINNALYPEGERKVCPQFQFKPGTKGITYAFNHEGDTGSGAKSRHLAIFDVAVLETTPLPYLIHDSAIIKLVAHAPVRELLQVYSNTKELTSGADEPKQVFFSFDATKSYGQRAEELVEHSRVIHLGDGSETLYGFSWNTQPPEEKEELK